MGELIAVRGDPRQVGPAIRGIWAAGDAALVLPSDGPEPAVARILAAQRPAALLDLRDADTGSVTREPRPDPLPAPVSLTLPAPVPLQAPLPVADDIALVVTTSGSTGRPKGVELTHTALQASTDASLERLGARPGERWALALPIHHVAGVQVLLRSWALGTDAPMVDHLDDLGACAAEHVSLVPTQLARLLDAGTDVSRFATILLGGAAARPDLLARAREAGANVVASYGMSETCGGCVYDGRPLDGVEVELVEGRVRVRGPVLFRGYRSDAPGTALDDDGWFTTGDLGRFEHGHLEVLGRADDVIISGGENVPVPAVETVLARAAGVAEVAVTARPDADWGQVVVAVVVPVDRGDPPTLACLRAHVREHHLAAWAPRQVVIVDALPRDPMGKVSRAELARAIGDA